MTPEISNLSFEYDSGLLISKKIQIPRLKQSAEIWINTEDITPGKHSKKQISVLSSFLEIGQKELSNIQIELRNYAQELLSKGKITKNSLSYSNSYDLTYTSLIIPKQDKTKNEYLFILTETNWKIPESEYVIELEILIKNNEFDFLQEYSGLWTITEWNDFYNSNKNIC